MDLIQSFIKKAKENPRKIVYPEGSDKRIVTAAARVKEMGIASPIIIGEQDAVRQIADEANVCLDDIKIITIGENGNTLDRYAASYMAERPVKQGIARKLVKKPLSFGGMMVKEGDADGMVAGVTSATASVIQSASLTIGYQEGMSTPSSFFIMIIPEYMGVENKVLLFADCAVCVSPDSRELAEIGIASGMNAKSLLDMEPNIAFLSFSTNGSASHPDVEKVSTAVNLAIEMKPEYAIHGELQADAAIVPRVAEKKVKDGSFAGDANVLIFPDLDAGNISYKLVQYLAKANAYGPILQGFARPVNDLSRGASVDDIIAVTAITVVQAQSTI